VRSETRPRHLSPRTRETVAWETPAARATSREGGRAGSVTVGPLWGGRGVGAGLCAGPVDWAHGTYDPRRYTYNLRRGGDGDRVRGPVAGPALGAAADRAAGAA